MKLGIAMVRAADGSSWTVCVPGRPDRVLARTANGYPLPPETGLMPASFMRADAADPARLAGAFARIQSGAPTPPDPAAGQPGDMVDFGSYLHAALFGSGWNALVAAAPDPCIELELSSPAADSELSRLPWEMMHADGKFLAARVKPCVSLVRRVPVDGARPLGASGPADLRVLFVIGNELSDPSIRAGAEYLGLLRRLRSQEMSLPHRLLLAATKEDVEEVARQYSPTIVHLTCHGDWNTVRLRPGESASPAERAQRFSPLSAAGLLALLPQVPQVVVVNSCDSASGRPPQPGGGAAASFAAELAQLGVPVVVGMGGKVADHASRLFTMRFYQALLELRADGMASPAAAAAEGRRAALRMSAGAETSEWIHSRVLVRADAEAEVSLGGIRRAQELERIASSFRTRGPLCDRFEAFRAFDRWLDGPHPERTLFVLRGADVTIPPVQYGCSHLLQELAAHAAASGYLPVVADVPTADNVAVRLHEMLRRIALAIDSARKRIGRPAPPLMALADLVKILREPGTAPTHPVLIERLQLARPEESETVAAALGADLSALAADADPFRPLLMLDDVHKWAPALEQLVEVLSRGIAFAGAAVPVALCCRRWPGQLKTDDEVRNLLEHPATLTVEVNRFREDQEVLAYRQFAMLRKPALVANPRKEDALDALEAMLRKYVDGVPSRFHDNTEVETVLTVLTYGKFLIQADDDSILQNARDGVP